MKSITKWTIGGLASAALLSGGIIFSKYESIPEEKRTISFENPQQTLDEAFRNCNPENISRIIYDPDFKDSDAYLRSSLSGRMSPSEIEISIQNSRKLAEGHYMSVADVSTKVGDGQKRQIFVRKELIGAPEVKSLADLENAIYHEDVHAEEHRNGYDFGGRIVRGEELTRLCNTGEIRPEVIIGIGEIDAYASQIERAKKSQIKPSRTLMAGALTQLHRGYSILEKGLSNEKLTILERMYAERVIAKHKDTIETLKKHN
ncbi:hypothetical protein J4423_00380 [Candidatus Pacearchaeota archaeon]|nr:hypothetical protein [Candidatus Pacearchaeota archaeon]